MAESVQLPDDIQRRLNAWKAVGALGVCAIYGWFAIVKDAQVPVLVFLDIAVHEIGHKLFSPFGNLIMLMHGDRLRRSCSRSSSGLVFGIWKRNFIAWGVCWAWSANAMCDGARYIYDAPRGELMLLGAGDGLGRLVEDPGTRALRQAVPGRSPRIPAANARASSRGSSRWGSSCSRS